MYRSVKNKYVYRCGGKIYTCIHAGASIPLRQWSISSCFRFSPYFQKNFQTVENFQFFVFIRQNFWWPFCLVIDYKFWISHLFSLSEYISPLISRKLLFPPIFTNSPLFSWNLRGFTYFMCISFPLTLTMMHLCITQRTSWTPLHTWRAKFPNFSLPTKQLVGRIA